VSFSEKCYVHVSFDQHLVPFSEKCYVHVSFDQHVASFSEKCCVHVSQVLIMAYLTTESLKPCGLRVACFLCPSEINLINFLKWSCRNAQQYLIGFAALHF
jgi:hypothetical protein